MSNTEQIETRTFKAANIVKVLRCYVRVNKKDPSKAEQIVDIGIAANHMPTKFCLIETDGPSGSSIKIKRGHAGKRGWITVPMDLVKTPRVSLYRHILNWFKEINNG